VDARSDAYSVSVSWVVVGRSGERPPSTYLTRLLLEGGELLDGSLNVCLCSHRPISTARARAGRHAIGTFARASASGICLSASLEKSFSGLNAASAIVSDSVCVST